MNARSMRAMLRGRQFGTLTGAVAVAIALLTPLAGQTRVKLQRNVGVGSLQAAIAELTVPSRMAAAQLRLWQVGEPAVPLLAAEIERGGAGEAAARFVLERLGCEAAAAVPVLQRIVENPKNDPARRARVAETLAKLDGPPLILVSDYSKNEVIEFDIDGNELRRVAVDSPWGAWPLPHDRFGVIVFGKGQVLSCDWQGRQEVLRELAPTMASVVALDEDLAGDVVFTAWNDKGELIRRSAAGEDVWTKDIDAVRVERTFGDQLVVVTRDNPRALWFAPDGEELRSVSLPEMGHNVEPLLGGGFLVSGGSLKVYEYGPDGKPVDHFTLDHTPNHVVRLRDGRTIVSTQNDLRMLGAGGKQLWSKPVAWGGPLFVRRPAQEVK